MSELHVSDEELRALLVDRLDAMDGTAFNAAVAASRRLKIPLERAVVERARLPLSFLLTQLAQAWDVGFTDLKVRDVQLAALRAIREDFAKTHLVVGFAVADKTLSVAMADPRELRLIGDLQRVTGMNVVPHLAPVTAIRRAHLLYRGDLRELLHAEGDAAVPATKAGAEDVSASDLVTRILEYAVVSGASDIHVEPYEIESLVRYRIDGVLHEVLSLRSALLPTVVARIKVLAGMRIDERRAPQDGRFNVDLGGVALDLRVSSVPTYWGEKVVMRVLTKETSALDIEDLGLVPADYPIVLKNLMRPFGMILITGPTGSGKTTTLYSMISRLGTERQNVVNISTIEDPVEHPLPRVSQIAVNPSHGVEFATGLRSLLRQDPDVIMVGEIRDRETADIAVRSALVGRLLLSTLHTNDATSAVPRLIDMGIEPFLLASTLQLVVAQRLARRICTSCRETLGQEPKVLEAVRDLPGFATALPILQMQGVLPSGTDPLSGIRLFRGRGCAQCGGTGFRGRVGVFELFEINDAIRRLIMDRQDASAIRAAALHSGMKTMFQDALAKVFLGETTLEEVMRVAQ
jgi:type IV pilus assembly protein PilB